MGIESTVYQLIPETQESLCARQVLLDFGAEEVDEHRFVLRGPEHWIDIQVGVPEPLVSLRVALCNPTSVLDVLRSVLAALLRGCEGEIVDIEGDRRISVLDEDTWRVLLASYELRRQEFRRQFGEMEAAISADEVFDYLERPDR
jgi:hypothetical protein